jgi:hypothetical protein
VTRRALFLYDKETDLKWLKRTVGRVNKRLAAVGEQLEPRYERHDLKPPFASLPSREKWVPYQWLLHNVGPLTRGEHIAYLCLGQKLWPRDTWVLGRVEYAPYNGVTFLSHIKTVRNETVWYRGGTKPVDLAENSILHELAHTFEVMAKTFDVVHKDYNHPENAIRELKQLIRTPILDRVEAYRRALLGR